jgi:F420H(2)-dependent quinone reductase
MTENAKKFTQWQEGLLKFLRWAITTGNVWLLKVSRGRLGNSFLGMQVLLLTTRGRKSGELRTLPLYYMEDGRRIVLVASNAGTSKDPAWLLNIRADPDVSADVRGQVRKMNARQASPDEKAQLWPRLTALFPQWKTMEDRSQRSFPLVILDSESPED